MSEVYVLGGAQTDFARNWTKEGKGVIALLKEVIEDTLCATNISYSQIEELNKRGKIACFIGNFCAEYYVNQGHLGALLTEVNSAFYGIPCARYEAACASGSVALDAAITKIRVEDYDVAIVIGWELMKPVEAKIGADYLGRAALYETEAKDIEYPFPKLFGALVDEIGLRYKVENEELMNQLAIIANKNYNNAKNNPNAQTRKWYMDEVYANARNTEVNPLIGKSLAITDCSQVTDGAASIVLVSEQYLKDNNIRKLNPRVKGWGHRVAPMRLREKLDDSMQDRYILPWTRQAVLDAYNRAGLGVEQMDVFETHDCFTVSEYLAISCFGITEPGEEYQVIESSDIMNSGKYPINPSGGLIGAGHPVGATGVRMFLDLYKQLTNKAGRYQIDNVRNGIMLNIGGTATTNYTFILGND